jgi:integrase
MTTIKGDAVASKRSNGEGSVRENKARQRWEGRVTVGFDVTGKPVRKMATGKTKAEVLRAMAELRGDADAGRDSARRDLTVRRFLEQWIDDVLPGTVAPATEQQYRDVVRLYVVPHLGLKRLRTLQARDVARMLRTLEEEGRSPNTRRLARSVLRRALRWAEAEGMVARNVAALANGVKVGRPEGRTLTPEQARVLLAHVSGDRLEAAFTVALSLGLRRGELLGLAWPDVTLDATPPRLLVTRTVSRIKGTGLVLSDTKTAGSRRTVHLPGPVVASLRVHRVRQAEERLAAGPEWTERPLGVDLIFRTPFGTPVDPDNFRNLTYKATTDAGLGRWSPHELRHSAASLLIAQGVPLKLVSETLGHASIRITSDVYGHLFDDAGLVAADAMTDALWGAE